MTLPGFQTLSRRQAACLVVLIWAAIYLPALGSLELKGEEGRRLLPAVSMLETGRWIVPSVGGVPYMSKPPLINWLAAGAFGVSGSRSEWAARAPSVLAVLALALTTVGALSAWLSPPGALLAAIFLLTNIGLMEKGRLAEIEALYLSLCGIAFVLWLGAWRREAAGPGGRPTWRAWTLPWAFLGLALLTKGPLHLVFFYAVVVAVLFCAGRGRDFWNWPHGAGVVLMLAIFGVWGVPFLQQVADLHGGGVWLAQFQDRLEVHEGFHAGVWALNIPRGLVNFLPWTVLLPLWWRPGAGGGGDALDRAILRGGRWAVTACFLAVSLAPGGQPRYTLPLLVPASVLLALVFRNCRAGVSPAVTADVPSAQQPELPAWLPVVWAWVVMICAAMSMFGVTAINLSSRIPVTHLEGPGSWRFEAALGIIFLAYFFLRLFRSRLRIAGWPALGLASAVGMALITADYAIGAVPRFLAAETMRPMAAQIDAAVPTQEPLAVLRPGFLPFLYYMRPGLVYVQRIGDLSESVHYLLVRQEEVAAVDASLRERHEQSRILLKIRDKRLKDDPRSLWLLLRLNPPPEPGL